MLTLIGRVAIYVLVGVGFYQSATSIPATSRMASAVVWPLSVGTIIGDNISAATAE